MERVLFDKVVELIERVVKLEAKVEKLEKQKNHSETFSFSEAEIEKAQKEDNERRRIFAMYSQESEEVIKRVFGSEE